MRTTILLFGLVCGVLIAVLQLIEYRFLVVEHSLQIYGALVAPRLESGSAARSPARDTRPIPSAPFVPRGRSS